MTVILRSVADKDGRLLHGELVNADGSVQCRFTGWQGLIHILRILLDNQKHEQVGSNDDCARRFLSNAEYDSWVEP
jgi:hypothetical protein